MRSTFSCSHICFLISPIRRPAHLQDETMDRISEAQNTSLVVRAKPERASLTFSNLPPEVRNKIYRLVVSFRTDDGTHKALKPKEFQIRYQKLLPKLLLSRQVLSEMLPILLGDNVIHLRAQSHTSGHGVFMSEMWDRISYSQIHRPISKRAGIQSYFFYHLEVPPSRMRQLFKQIKITIEAPMFTKREVKDLVDRDIGDDERPWSMSEFDWLYPVRELQTLGFGRLEELQIEIERGWMHSDTSREAQEMEAWAGSRLWEMKAMNVIGAEKLQVDFVRD